MVWAGAVRHIFAMVDDVRQFTQPMFALATIAH
jgi:hypothetical protein